MYGGHSINVCGMRRRGGGESERAEGKIEGRKGRKWKRLRFEDIGKLPEVIQCNWAPRPGPG